MTPAGLTSSQQHALTFIKTYIGSNGHSPSLDEIGEAIGKRKTRAHSVVQSLIERGHIASIPYRARSISVVTQ